MNSITRTLLNLFLITIIGGICFYLANIIEYQGYYFLQHNSKLASIHWLGMDSQLLFSWLVKLICYGIASFILFLLIRAANLNHWLWICVFLVIVIHGFFGVQSTVELLDLGYLIDWCKFVLSAPLGVLVGGKIVIYLRLAKYNY